jgi:hypothetical protein
MASNQPKLTPGDVATAGGKTYIIFKDQVRQGGSCSWIARNPGNIRNGDSMGAISGKKHKCGSSGMFAIFPDEASGFAAISKVLKAYGHITVLAAMNKYAPSGDGGNDPKAYAQKVAKSMGVTVDSFVDKLSSSQLNTFATAIKNTEGWIPGKAYSLSDASLPQEIKDRL